MSAISARIDYERERVMVRIPKQTTIEDYFASPDIPIEKEFAGIGQEHADGSVLVTFMDGSSYRVSKQEYEAINAMQRDLNFYQVSKLRNVTK